MKHQAIFSSPYFLRKIKVKKIYKCCPLQFCLALKGFYCLYVQQNLTSNITSFQICHISFVVLMFAIIKIYFKNDTGSQIAGQFNNSARYCRNKFGQYSRKFFLLFLGEKQANRYQIKYWF